MTGLGEATVPTEGRCKVGRLVANRGSPDGRASSPDLDEDLADLTCGRATECPSESLKEPFLLSLDGRGIWDRGGARIGLSKIADSDSCGDDRVSGV